jgi:DNA (cytosine-5)-methyltransferase 1
MNFIDLFAGAGGLSEGFIRNNFTPLAHVEIDKYACSTLKTRMGYYFLKNNGNLNVYNQYTAGEIERETFYSRIPNEVRETVINQEISDSTIEEIFNLIDKNIERMNKTKVDIIIGGPPCQAYSLVGRSRDPYRKERDERNFLYKQYVKFLKRYKPKLFIFENVPGILNAAKGTLFKDVKKYMDEAGYEIDAEILDASKFGVMQKRKRVIIFGWLKGLNLSYPTFEGVKHNFKVQDVLSDLPKLIPGESIEYGNYKGQSTEYLQQFNIREVNDKLLQHISRTHNNRDREIYRKAIAMWNKENRRLKYNELPKSLRTHSNLKSFLDRFKVVGADQDCSHTVVAHIAKDGHYYIHPDIDQLRSLSVREAARLQSFPDNFYFEGPRTSNFTQIGNAVPPLMAEGIANKIKEAI